MNNTLTQLSILLNMGLKLSCPVLSGSMKNHISKMWISNNQIEIEIAAPFYDLKVFNKTKKVQYTGATNKMGETDYATAVNNKGGFGSHNSSEHWVNRVCFQTAMAIANQIGAHVINKLPL